MRNIKGEETTRKKCGDRGGKGGRIRIYSALRSVWSIY
jgi:hypothetical protein